MSMTLKAVGSSRKLMGQPILNITKIGVPTALLAPLVPPALMSNGAVKSTLLSNP